MSTSQQSHLQKEAYENFFEKRGIECFIRLEYTTPTGNHLIDKEIKYSAIPRLYRKIGFEDMKWWEDRDMTPGSRLVCTKNNKVLNEKEFEKETGFKKMMNIF